MRHRFIPFMNVFLHLFANFGLKIKQFQKMIRIFAKEKVQELLQS